MRLHPHPGKRPVGASHSFLALQALAMVAVMASTGSLSVLAARRSLSTTPAVLAQRSGPNLAPGLWIANKDDDEKKKKRKPDYQQHKQHQNQQQKPQQIRQSGQRKQNQNRSDYNKLNHKERDRIHFEGLEKGKDKGYRKGSSSGFDKGIQEGRDTGKPKGFDRGYDRRWDADRRAREKDRWKDWDSNRWREYNRSQRNVWVKRTVVNNNFYAYPSWARNRGWYGNRPWGGGWYGGWNSPPWGWWVGQSVVWGVTALTTAAILNNAIDRAIERSQTVVAVPNTNWQLYYGTVRPIAQSGVIFAVNNGYGTYEMEADCREGLLNGEVPTTATEAQLLNAACQVAFGRGL